MGCFYLNAHVCLHIYITTFTPLNTFSALSAFTGKGLRAIW